MLRFFIIHENLSWLRVQIKLKTKTKEKPKKHDGKECKRPAAISIRVLGTTGVRLTKGKPYIQSIQGPQIKLTTLSSAHFAPGHQAVHM